VITVCFCGFNQLKNDTFSFWNNLIYLLVIIWKNERSRHMPFFSRADGHLRSFYGCGMTHLTPLCPALLQGLPLLRSVVPNNLWATFVTVWERLWCNCLKAKFTHQTEFKKKEKKKTWLAIVFWKTYISVIFHIHVPLEGYNPSFRCNLVAAICWTTKVVKTQCKIELYLRFTGVW